MNEEEKFKKSLQDLLESKDFSFEEGNWRDAEKLIIASRRKKKLRPLLWLLPVLLGAGYMIYLLTDQNLSTQQNKMATLTSGQQAPATTSEITVAPSPKTSAGMPAKALPSEAEAPTAQKSRPDQARLPEHSGDMRQDLSSPESHSIDPDKTHIDAQNSVRTLSATKPKEEEEKVKQSPLPFIENKNENLAEDNRLNNGTEQEEALTRMNAGAIKNEKPAEIKEQEGKITERSSAAEIVPEQRTEPGKPVAAISPLLPDSSGQKEEIASKGDSLPMPMVATARPDTDYVRLRRPLLTFEAGTHAMRGWMTEAGREGNSLNPFAGLVLYRHLSDHLSMNTGIQYYSIGNLKASTYVAKTTNYSFGEQSQVKKFTPGRLHYLSVPLQVSYNMSNGGMLGGGINISYLLTADVALEEYTEKQGATLNNRAGKEKGYTQGFNDFNTQVGIFYRRPLWKDFFVNAEVFMGLKSIKNDFFEGADGNEKNSGLRLTLGYYILKTR